MPTYKAAHETEAVVFAAYTGRLHGVIRPTADHPASQYFDSVQRGSVADKAGLKTGDYLLEVRSSQFRISSQYT